MSKRYYVDYENVNKSGLVGFDQLCDSDEVFVLYTPASSTMPIGLHEKISASGNRITFLRAEAGHQALDCQLMSLLGYDICKYGTEVSYRIVSKDHGYHFLQSFWRRACGADVQVVGNLCEDYSAMVADYIKENCSEYLSRSEVKRAARIANRHAEQPTLDNALKQSLGDEKGARVCAAIAGMLKGAKAR